MDMKIAGLLVAGVSLALAACGSSSVTRTFVLTEPGNTTLEAVVTASSENLDLFKNDLAATEPSGAAFTTKDGDQHTLARVCSSSFQTPDGTANLAIFAAIAFPTTICQELVKLATTTPSASPS
jgi:hypothetical protein